MLQGMPYPLLHDSSCKTAKKRLSNLHLHLSWRLCAKNSVQLREIFTKHLALCGKMFQLSFLKTELKPSGSSSKNWVSQLVSKLQLGGPLYFKLKQNETHFSKSAQSVWRWQMFSENSCCFFNTSSLCVGRWLHCHRVPPLPPEQWD